MRGLSAKQQKILEFLRRFIQEKDYPPSIRDIQLGCNISSTSVVDYNLKALERLGHIRRDREGSRAIELLDGSGRRPHTVPVPIIGTIAAGQPIPVPTEETWSNIDYDNVVEVTRDMTGGKERVYALRVKGDSMIDALVNDGDIVIMEATSAAKNGDMVAAWLKREGEATLKKIFVDGERVRLQPANERVEPIFTDPENVEVQGRVLTTISQRG
ncbi:MAG: repressor LexA [Chloroflexi bacterium RBG_16_68_14]|nr:MAG: repressor LexA [Chloroflexi bacterium RBG_16_68_14]